MRVHYFLIAAILGLTGFTHAAIAQSAGGIDPRYPAVVSNQNVWKIYQDYQLMIEEIDKSVTKKNAGLLSHDATRWKSYIVSLRAYVAYWAQNEFLDFPVTHGRDWEITGPLSPNCDFKQNTAACELIALVVSARDELVLSASAKLPIHLYPADAERQAAYWASMEGYIDYMASNSPLDQPVTAAEDLLGLEPGFQPPVSQ